MHYYRRNIADYRKKTAHLSHLEHGIYNNLLDTYYMNEAPLDKNTAKLMRSHCIRSDDEKEAFANVLEDFFTLTDDGYRHAACDKELESIYNRSEQARKNAKARWDKCESNASAMQTHSNGNANASTQQSKNDAVACKSDAMGMLPNTQYPIPNTQQKTFSLEPSIDDSQQDIFIRLPTVKFNSEGEEYPVTSKQVKDFCECYPAVDIEQTLREIKAWCITNTKNRKTFDGIPKFINNWLSKSQNRGGNSYANNKQSNERGRQSFAERQRAQAQHALNQIECGDDETGDPVIYSAG